MTHCFILGTRPEIIKLSPLIRVAQQRKLDFSIIHTNQHYSASMDAVFFRELQLPEPDVNLHIGSGNHSAQTGEMLVAIGRELDIRKPDIVYVEGDTNTVLAGALAATKRPGTLLAHVEAGLRSYDRTMPEEINRIVTDHISDLLFAPTATQAAILQHEGIDPRKTFITGNSVVDAIVQHLDIAKLIDDPLKTFALKSQAYAVLTMHRPANVDNPKVLSRLIEAINSLADRIPILFAVHPRTQTAINALKPDFHRHLRLIEPIGYLQMLQLMRHAKCIVTDSGGIQEEACVLQVPCITLRENTERPETVEVGGNILVGSDKQKLLHAFDHFTRTNVMWNNPFGDGHSAEHMIEIATNHVDV